MPQIIAIKNLSFNYSSNEVLSDITFNVHSGDYVGIVGSNGSGKTTLIRIILGLLKPKSGEVRFFGNDSGRFSDWNKIGYLPQKFAAQNIFFPASVKEIIELGLLSKKSSLNSKAIDRVLDLLEIREIKDKLIGDLSGGQQQRTFLARALINDPELLILDEPTAALDPEVREKFFVLIGKLNKEANLTVLLVTHDVGTIGKYASKLLYLDKKIIFYGDFGQFCESADVGEYFGEFSHHIICHRHDKDKNI